MGIPKFFRYISARYPCLSETLKQYQIPEFDNLYLDMNGIIHNSSHPNDSSALFYLSEEEIFRNIFHYVEVLFRMIQPQSLFFIAVDGVAPRAKINHQRGRRFKTAKDAEIQEAKAKAKGIEIQEDKKFDSNCITPGTVFMAKLNEQLRYFVAYKVSTDKLWQRCKVIYSGSEVPGEGEHKIMDYIRYLKSQPDYNVNTRHCLYGLDADLIMLGLCTHEPYFSLLRGEVKLSERKQKRIIFPEETKFCLLHLSLLRDYINHEFSPIKDKLSFAYDLEKIIDDWILMGFLVGNDFIPHLPNLHIANGALAVLYHAYMEVLPTLDGYINESGTLRLDRFEKFMERLSRVDIEQFAEYYADLKFFEGKTGRRPDGLTKHSYKLSVEKTEEDDGTKTSAYSDFNSMCESTDMSLGNSDEDDEMDSDSNDNDYDIDMYNVEFAQHKKDYYMNKLEYENVDEDVLRSQAEGYVRAIQWNLHYYYYGCCSWSWYYPHHYAPYISDIKGFKDLKLEFELGEPFLPFQQLLAVLPKYSKNLLPAAFQDLLSDADSPIIDYYPVDFKTDLNGKRQEWEAVVLIPFINNEELSDAMAPHMHKLTPKECERNKHGPMSLYTYTKENLGICKAPEYFVDVMNHAKVQLISREELFVPREKLVMGICPGLNLDIYVLGFPKLRHIEHIASLEKAEVKVFEQASRSENMILHFISKSTPPLADVASQILGKIVYVEWPYLTEAQVIAVFNNGLKINLINPEIGYSLENISSEEFKGPYSVYWHSEKKRITTTYKTRLGVDIGATSILVHACPITGSRYVFDSDGKVYLQKEWSQTPITYAYQAVVTDISMLSTNKPQYKSINEIFTPGSICFMLSHRHYGETAEVLKYETNAQPGRIDVFLKVPNEPVLKSIKQMYAEKKTQYMQCNVAAQRLGISSHLFSRITGTIHVSQGINEQQKVVKHNIGLNLKFNKKNEEIPGYTKKENGQWLYSTKVIDLIRRYMVKCPDLFERLAKNVANDTFHENQLFDKTTEEFSSAVAWLKEQLRGIESRPCGADILDTFLVQKLEELIDAFVAEEPEDKYIMIAQIKVKTHLLFKPGLHSRNSPPDPKSQNFLFDRVVCVRESFTVPLGLRGTIIGIQRAENVLDTLYDVLFDKPFLGGVSLNGSSESRGYRLLITDFVNISHGRRMEYPKMGMSDVKVVDTWKQLSKLQNQSRITPPFRVENNHSSTFPPNSPQVHIFKKNVDNKDHIKLPIPIKWKQQQQGQSPSEDCTDVKVEPEHASPQVPQKPPTKLTFEFQALWNELHKIQESNASAEKSLSTSTGTKTKQPAKYVSKNSPQDPSAFLKAMLKISDDDTQRNTVPKPTAPTVKPPAKVVSQSKKVSDTPPPLVQQLFDHARQTEKKKDEKNPIWYCSRLLNHFQLTGMGMPRYSYFTEGDKLIRAHILLPDLRVFAGNFCATHAQAAESAAEKVYKELHLDKALTPDAKILLTPPNQWYNSRQNTWSQNVTPVMPACSMKVHQLPQNPVTQFPKWNPKAQQNVGYQTAVSHTNQNQPQQKQNMYKQPKAEVKNNTPFVPLQAQKKSRSINVKRTAKDANQSVKENPPITIQRKREETLPKAPGVDNSNKNQSKHESDTSMPGNNSQHSSKSQKSAKPRRSRVAAKFGAVSLTNEAEPQ